MALRWLDDVEELCQTGIDFASFGTNDITQYTPAVDRNNEAVATPFDELHPAVLELIGRTIETSREYDVATSICGQAGPKREMVHSSTGESRRSAPTSTRYGTYNGESSGSNSASCWSRSGSRLPGVLLSDGAIRQYGRTLDGRGEGRQRGGRVPPVRDSGAGRGHSGYPHR